MKDDWTAIFPHRAENEDLVLHLGSDKTIYANQRNARRTTREALRVFPLLVKGATLPIPDAVPLNLRPLLRRHGYPIRRDLTSSRREYLQTVCFDSFNLKQTRSLCLSAF
jgi:hypothetical protein